MNTPEMHIDPELLSAYLDEEVTTEERQLIETHLPGCANCQKELDSLRFTMAMVQALPPRPIPRTFYVTEEMVAPQAKAQTAGWWGWLRGLAPFGAALAALLVVVVVSNGLFSNMGAGGAAMPSSAPAAQPQEAEIAVLTTEENAEPGTAADSAAGGESAETRQATVVAGESTESTLTEPPAESTAAPAEPTTGVEGAPESMPEDGQVLTNTYTATDASGMTGTDTVDITATDPIAPIAVAPTAKVEDGRNDEDVAARELAPATINTTLIITAIVVLIVVGTIVIVVRQRK